MNYSEYAMQLLSTTKKEKSSNVYRVLFALNSNSSNGLAYTQILNFSPAFNQSSLSRTLTTCKERNLISYDETTKLYSSNMYCDLLMQLSSEAYKWLKYMLLSRLIGSDITIIRLSLFLISENQLSLSDISSTLEIPMPQIIDALKRINEELNTQIITYDRNFLSANLSWF